MVDGRMLRNQDRTGEDKMEKEGLEWIYNAVAFHELGKLGKVREVQ